MCVECGTAHPLAWQGPCSCGGFAEVRYPADGGVPSGLPDRHDLWRYAPLLPVDPEAAVTLGEGGTPLRPLEEGTGPTLYVKDEGQSPTATFKARGMAVAVSMARRLQRRRLVVPSAGNAGVALAAYARAAGLEALVLAPQDTPPLLLQAIVREGATCLLLPGLLDTAGPYVQAAVAAGYANLATLREPYRVEGKKTMGLEVWERLGNVPDWIVFPTGGGTGIVGLWKAFRELAERGWSGGKVPRLCAVQSDGCAPLARTWEAGGETLQSVAHPHTAAAGLRVPRPAAYRLVLRALRETRGLALQVPEAGVVPAAQELAQRGVDACYEGGAAYLGLRQLIGEGQIGPGETAILFNTGPAWINDAGEAPDLPLLHRPEDLAEHLPP